MNTELKRSLLKLIDNSSVKGLSISDVNAAKEYLIHNELGLCFDTIVSQLYEYEIDIDEAFYEQIEKIAGKMNIETADYSYMKELIK